MNYVTTKPYSALFNDIFFRDLFGDDFFSPLASLKKIPYPVDIYENSDGLYIDIAAIGIEKSDIKIDIKDNILNVSHDKQNNIPQEYAYNGITKKAFNLAWRINEKFNLNEINATLDKGLLKLFIPIAAQKKTKQISVQIN
jgi:HSP20 family protein